MEIHIPGSNNTAIYTLMNTTGCDSVVTLDLTITSLTSTDVIIACDSHTWIDGNTYNSSNNTATHLLTSSSGCDSIITLDLTINSSISSTDVVLKLVIVILGLMEIHIPLQIA